MAEHEHETYGQVRNSEIEVLEYEEALKAKRIIRLPSNQLLRLDYEGGANPIYVGSAPKGVADSASGWLLHKLAFNASSYCTARGIAYDAWDNRASADYV